VWLKSGNKFMCELRVYIFVIGSCDGGNFIHVANYCKLGTYKYDLEI